MKNKNKNLEFTESVENVLEKHITSQCSLWLEFSKHIVINRGIYVW